MVCKRGEARQLQERRLGANWAKTHIIDKVHLGIEHGIEVLARQQITLVERRRLRVSLGIVDLGMLVVNGHGEETSGRECGLSIRRSDKNGRVCDQSYRAKARHNEGAWRSYGRSD